MVHEVVDALKKLNLSVCFSKLLSVLRCIFDSLVCIKLQFNHLVSFLVALKFTFCVAQFCIDFLQAAIDKLLCSDSNLVLVVVGLAVVAEYQLTKIIQSSLWTLVLKNELRNGSHLAGLRYIKVCYVFICSNLRRIDDNFYVIAIFHWLVGCSLECKYTCTCTNSGRKFVNGSIYIIRTICFCLL